MRIIHKEAAAGRWVEFSLMEQLGNVGSDIERALELLDLTIRDPKNRERLKEPVRARELLVDYFMFDNIYGTSDIFWQTYFNQFAYIAALQKGK